MRTTSGLLAGLALVLGACAAEPDLSRSTAQSPLCEGAQVIPEICSTLEAAAASADGKADDAAHMRGIVVDRVGDWTYFKVPLAYTFEGDRQALFDKTVRAFREELGVLNRTMIDRGIDLTGVLTEAESAEFSRNYLHTLEGLFNADLDERMERELGRNYGSPRELWSWERYLAPQAYIGYFSAKFSANLGVGGGFSLTLMLVVQPWLTVAVDHTLAEPVVVERGFEVDATIMGVPNVDLGFGAGGGLPIRIGVGAVFGPLDRPEGLAGWGLGVSGSLALPIVGGAHGKLLAVLQSPPLFLLMLGYSSGTEGGFEVHGNAQYLMDLPELLTWIGSVTRPPPPPRPAPAPAPSTPNGTPTPAPPRPLPAPPQP